MNFLPQDYEAPRSSNYYMKLVDGENRFRILSQPVLGWEDWIDKKPVRYRMEDKPAKPHDPAKPIKHFWSFIVFNYAAEEIQILHLTQATIRHAIEDLCKDKDWGHPSGYDIKIVKKGQMVDTSYTINPVPHKPLDDYIVKCFEERRCNLEALYDSADPFAKGGSTYTPLSCVDRSMAKETQSISDSDIEDIHVKFGGCPEDYRKKFMESLAKLPTPVMSLHDIPPAIFHKLKASITAKYDEEQSKNLDFFDIMAG